MPTELDHARRPDLSPEQRALVDEQFRTILDDRPKPAGTPAGATAVAAGQVRAGDGSPLSPAQERLWWRLRLSPGGAQANLPLVLNLSGRLDVALLERSLSEIVHRHEVLRSTFVEADGEPRQVVHEASAIALPPRFVGGDTRAERLLHVRLEAMAEARQSFDPERGPLLRARLLRLGDRAHVLLLTLHRLVADERSLDLLVEELGTLYDAFADGESSPLPEPSLRYADYAAWQRQWLDGQEAAQRLAFWARTLRDAPAPPNLPTDRPLPARRGDRAARHRLALGDDLTDALMTLGDGEEAALFSALLATWQALLHRYTGQDNLLIGCPTTGRSRPGTAELIGPLAGTLFLRADLTGDPTFRELLRRVRRASRDAFDHQDAPPEHVIAELWPRRALDLRSWTPIGFAFRDEPAPLVSLPESAISRLDVVAQGAPGSSPFDLALDLRAEDDEIAGWIEYATDLFDGGTIGRMATHLRTLLEGAVTDPDQRLSTLPLLTEAERHLVLTEWGGDGPAEPVEGTLHGLFEAQVERTPDAVALICRGERLTYQELNRRANRLAHRLRTLDVGPDVPVALCLERSLDLVVAVLGTLKAGGAYLPLDPTDPDDRLESVLADSGAPVLVTRMAIADRLPPHQLRVVRLDADRETLEREPEANSSEAATAETAAYVLYHADARGAPTGVVGPHRGAVNRCRWLWAAYPFVADEVCGQTTGFGSIDAVGQLFGPLLRGIPTVLLPDDAARDPDLLVATLAEHGVTRLDVDPPLLRTLLDRGGDLRGRLPRLGLWSSHGEPLPGNLAARFFERVPEGRLLACYGSAEVAGDAICSEVTRTIDRRSPVPLGRPIANVVVRVLDRHRQPVPIGVPGELWIGGAGLARGYLYRSEQTAERFVPDATGGESDGLLFRTGVRVRWRADGNLEHLGLDDERVEAQGRGAALTSPAGTSTSDPAFVAPRTPEETALADIWSEFLGVQQVGVHDDFFDLGGDPLRASQVLAQTRDAFGVELPLRTLFEAPTVAELAARIAVGPSAIVTQAGPLIPLQPNGTARPVFVVPGGPGGAFHLFKDAQLAHLVGSDHPFYGFLGETCVDERDPQAWVETVAVDYVDQIRARGPAAPYLLVGVCAGGPLAFEVARLLAAERAGAAELLLIDAWNVGGMDLERINPGNARMRALLRCRPGHYPGRVTLLANEEWHGLDPTLRWDRVVGGGVEVRVLPGKAPDGHNIYLGERMDVLAREVRRWLAEVDSAAAAS